MALPLPARISQYEIRRVLGQGGMGLVYLAVDPGLQRQVALKVLRTDSDDQRERFRREARIVARLQHPNIVQIYAVGEHEQQLFIAMEYIDGEPLSEGLRRRAPWSLQRRLTMATDLCAGLAFAHRAGVIHRDIKPSNLMVTNGAGTVRLLDFGIARGADPAATMGLTLHGNIVGTLNYMSPEQITGQALDHRSDIFAVGAVLYELLAYRQAFPGDNLATLTYRIVHGAPEPLRSLLPELDPALCTIVERAMARDPAARYPHLEAMRTDLLRAAAALAPEAAGAVGQAIAAGRESPLPPIWSRSLDPTVLADGPATPRSTAPLAETTTAIVEAGPGPRRWTRPAAVAGGVVAAGVLATWLVTGAADRPTPPPPGPPVPVQAPDTQAMTPADRPTAEGAVAPGSRTTTREGTTGSPNPASKDAVVRLPTDATRAAGHAPDSRRGGATIPGTSVTEPATSRERPRDTPTPAASTTPPVVAPPARELATSEPLPSSSPVRESSAPSGQAATSSEAPVVSDEALVQATLSRWARAYSARDARGVDSEQPGTAGTLDKQFAALTRVDVVLSGCRVDVQGTRATADCAEQFAAETRFGGKPMIESRRRTFELQKSSGAWRITGARVGR